MSTVILVSSLGIFILSAIILYLIYKFEQKNISRLTDLKSEILHHLSQFKLEQSADNKNTLLEIENSKKEFRLMMSEMQSVILKILDETKDNLNKKSENLVNELHQKSDLLNKTIVDTNSITLKSFEMKSYDINLNLSNSLKNIQQNFSEAHKDTSNKFTMILDEIKTPLNLD
jgi:hypothetical protein